MKIDNIKNLLELFQHQYQKKNKEDIFLKLLKRPQKEYSWESVYLNIIRLSEEINKKYTNINIDYKYFAGSRDPIEIINK